MSSVFAVDADVEQLRGVVADFLADVVGTPVADGVAGEEVAGQWHRAAAELGLAGLLAPEPAGGTAAGWRAMSAVLEEAGRVLWRGPLLATAVAVCLLADVDAADPWLARLVTGDAVAGVVLDQRDHRRLVLGPHDADLVLEPTARGLRVHDPAAALSVATTLDLTRTMGWLEPHRSTAPAMLDGDDHRALTARLLRAGIAAEQVGAARACLELSVAHAKDREQFGKPIGAFQAIRHRCAEMLVHLERATSLLGRAAWAVEVAAATAEDDVTAATAVCGEALEWAAAETIQVHGGIGFTWDHPAHLYYRRAMADRALTGRPSDHLVALGRARLAAQT